MRDVAHGLTKDGEAHGEQHREDDPGDRAGDRRRGPARDFPRCNLRWWKLGHLKGHAIQYPFLNLEQFLNKMDRYSSLRAEEMFKDGKRFSVLNIVVNPLAMFFRMFIAKRGFLDGTVGLMLSLLYGYYYTMIKYVKLWEKTRHTIS
ncbi:MAG: hypothetical protein WCG51_06825 [Elusimicrobiota bacterium]